jgi:hypothetical protein
MKRILKTVKHVLFYICTPDVEDFSGFCLATKNEKHES